MSPDDVLCAAGLSPEQLEGGDWPLEAVLAAVRRLRELLVGADALNRELCRDGAIRRLRVVVDSPARIVDAAFAEDPVDDPVDDEIHDTYGGGILDVVRNGDRLEWLVVEDGEVQLADEHDGRRPWARSNLPWPAIPAAPDLKAALEAGGRPPYQELMELHSTRAVLPDPKASWASLLAAWTLGTYLLDSFHYFPILLLDGPAERGKTRCAKSVLWPSHRGMYTPSPSPATIFRDRARHRVAILLDVEDLPKLLDRGSDIGDLALNSFERDGVIRRCTRPDALPEEQVETFAAYGPTIICTNRSVRDSSPLASRCIRLAMPEAGGRIVPDAMRPQEALLLRARCLAWAASLEESGVDLPKVDVALRGRARDLALPLLRVLALVAPEDVEPVAELLAGVDAVRRAESSRSWEARVAVALPECRDMVDGGRLYIEDLAPVVNDGVPESEQLTNQQIGTARRSLGLQGGTGGRRKVAYLRWPGDEMVDALARRYGNGLPHPPASPVTRVVAGDSARETPQEAQETPETGSPPETRLAKPRQETQETRETADEDSAEGPPRPPEIDLWRGGPEGPGHDDDDDDVDPDTWGRMDWPGPDGNDDDDDQRGGRPRPPTRSVDGEGAA